MRSLLIFCMWVFWMASLQAAESNLYDFQWLDPDKKVYVLQNKIHKKEQTTYVHAGVLTVLNAPFQDSYGYQVNAGHYFTEEFAIEGVYTRYIHSNNENYDNVRAVNSSEPFVRRIKQSAGVMAVWSPFYGKVNTFNKIIYFDWHFAAGPAFFETESNLNTVTDPLLPGRYEKETHAGAITRTGLRIHFSPQVHLGIDLFNSHYMAPGPTNKTKDKLRMQNDGILSIGFSF